MEQIKSQKFIQIVIATNILDRKFHKNLGNKKQY